MASKTYFSERLVAILLVLGGLALAIFVAWGIWKAAFPGLPPLQGQMESRVINVSPLALGILFLVPAIAGYALLRMRP